MSRIQPFSVAPEDAAEWVPQRPGVEVRRLFKHAQTGYEVALVRYAAGARVPSHRHVADEHVYVLSGSQRDQRGLYPAGSYVFNAAGSSHEVCSDGGCLALVHWLAPVQFT